MKKIYYSLIYSHLVYAIEVWGSADETLLENLLTIQEKAVRAMVFKDNYPPIPGPLNPADPIFKYLHILKFKDIYNLKILKFVYKWIHMLIPKNFDNSFIRNRDVHNNDTQI